MRESLPTIQVALAVGAGGFVGAVARWATTAAALAALGGRWPLGTLAANCLGCLLLGALKPWESAGGSLWTAALVVGFCGAYTTFSTFAWEVSWLAREGSRGAAIGYVAASLILGLGCVVWGYRIGQGWHA